MDEDKANDENYLCANNANFSSITIATDGLDSRNALLYAANDLGLTMLSCLSISGKMLDVDGPNAALCINQHQSISLCKIINSSYEIN